ncbi:hypothetical protein BD310DRAFT_630237 [Dichomitus squalens]|uniref:Uncharacterized protein n=1 Tax=Dichomitus squalens TaxID=114155 RepID=A0A4Q9PQ24_9APHY|nr:hypothetical protein BD310DRAFT_630237 [Dichomitus squalens]
MIVDVPKMKRARDLSVDMSDVVRSVPARQLELPLAPLPRVKSSDWLCRALPLAGSLAVHERWQGNAPLSDARTSSSAIEDARRERTSHPRHRNPSSSCDTGQRCSLVRPTSFRTYSRRSCDTAYLTTSLPQLLTYVQPFLSAPHRRTHRQL